MEGWEFPELQAAFDYKPQVLKGWHKALIALVVVLFAGIACCSAYRRRKSLRHKPGTQKQPSSEPSGPCELGPGKTPREAVSELKGDDGSGAVGPDT
jgi:hypothetical protein